MLLNVIPQNSPTKGTLIRATYIGGESKLLKPPFSPFFYSVYSWPGATQVSKKRLSDLREVRMWRPEFMTDFIRRKRGKTFGVLEGNVDYLRRLAAVLGFKSTSDVEPDLLSWDLESRGEGINPDPNCDILRSIAAWRYESSEPIKEFKSGSEPDVVDWFVELVSDVDPDVLMDYNGAFYDIPLLMNACRRHGIRCALGRDGSEPDVYRWEVQKRGRVFRKARVRIAGRVHFDAYKEVDADQGLFDLKDRRLHTVSKHFGLNPIEGVDHADIPIDRLAEVNLDDARITYGVAQVYLPMLYELCELLELPLSMMVQRSPSYIGELIYMRAFDSLGIVSDGTNSERFPWAWDGEGKAYEGAVVRCFAKGLFKLIQHFDFGSFYPNICIAGNFSPESVKLLSVKKYTGKYRFKHRGDFAYYEVPDKYRGQVRVRVDLSEDSVTKTELMKFLELRKKAKAEYNRTKEFRWWSRSWAIKVIANAIYGYNGMKFSKYGNLLVAILTTAMGRYIINNSIKDFREDGYKMVETDTDGWWCLK